MPMPAAIDRSLVIDPALRAQVEDFLSDYAQAIDDDQLERWPEFFTADGFYQIIPREGFEAGHAIGILSCAGRGMMQDRISALRTANIFEPHTYCHLLGRSTLSLDAEGAIAARSSFALYRTIQGGSTELLAAGKYIDRIIVVNGVLLFSARRAVVEARRVDTLIVVPI